MRARATPSLASLPRARLLASLAEGLQLIAEHVAALEAASSALTGPSARRAAAVVQVVAEEEAGKYLVLLDAARAARLPPDVRARQLKRCNNHIAKAVYAEVAGIRPADFAELIAFTRHLQANFYLDGPNDLDWIFRNSVEASREERLYVDYIESDEGVGWLSPSRYDVIGTVPGSPAVDLVAALHAAGLDTESGIDVVDDVWHDFIPTLHSQWIDIGRRNEATLDELRKLGVSRCSPADEALIMEAWTFPLHSTEVERIDVDVDELRQRRDKWRTADGK